MLKARLDKTGWRILCGDADCGTEICHLKWMDTGAGTPVGPWGHILRLGGPYIMRTEFRGGWHWIDGELVLTRRSQKRIRAKLDRGERAAIQRGIEGGMVAWEQDGKYMSPRWVNEADPPFIVHCPRCGRRNIIERLERASVRRSDRWPRQFDSALPSLPDPT